MTRSVAGSTGASGRSVSARATSRPRAGKRFLPTHELALLNDALQVCASLPGASRGVLVLAEMTGPIGIPDLTALVGPVDQLNARIAQGVPPLLSEVDAGVVAVAHPNRGLSVEGLAEAVGWPAETVGRRVAHLLRKGALVQSQPGRYRRPPALAPLGRLYAVEAKVRDWRRGLRQVRSYSVWADSYVLVMGPLAAGPLVQLRNEVAGDQGGLVVDGKWVMRPRLHPLPPARRLWASEHFMAAVAVKDYQPSPAP